MSVEAKQAKQVVIDEIKERMEKSVSVVVVDYLGLTVSEADELRKTLRENNVGFTVYKNTLVKRAIEGTAYEPLADILKGSSAFAFCEEDATASARLIKKFMKSTGKMAFKGGVVDGEYYDASQIEALAEIPSREELIARFMGSVKSPISKFVRTVQAIVDNGGAAEGGDAEAPAAEETAEA
jgi:large subunit ribosomal protein L10